MRTICRTSFLTLFLSIICAVSANAQAPAPSSMSNSFVVLMVTIIGFLALIIALLAYVLVNAASIKVENELKEKAANLGKTTLVLLIGAVLLVSTSAYAQSGEAASNISTTVSEATYYTLASVAVLELGIILTMLLMLRSVISVNKPATAADADAVVSKAPTVSWWDKINSFKPIQQEADIDLGHNYDGIRELDNRLPPWWLYGFYCCILFAVIYLWRFHVAESAPLSKEEYEIAVADAEVAKAAYLEKSANNVDENTVKLLTDEASLAPARKIFETTCAACHNKNGSGSVGPNLTDDYWLHGGSIQDVFKTLKYGWPEKGMKSWKDDYSPMQLAQLASFVKSLRGTNPPSPKAPQGVLYQEAGVKPDSAAAPKKDSTVVTSTK